MNRAYHGLNGVVRHSERFDEALREDKDPRIYGTASFASRTSAPSGSRRPRATLQHDEQGFQTEILRPWKRICGGGCHNSVGLALTPTPAPPGGLAGSRVVLLLSLCARVMATTLDLRSTLHHSPTAQPTEPTTTRGVSSTSGTLPSTTEPGIPPPLSTTSTSTSTSTSTRRSTTRTRRPSHTFSTSSSSTDASLSSSSSPTPALPSNTASIDPVPSGTLVIPLPNPSQDSNTAAGTPLSRSKASTQNVVIAVVSAAALIGLAAVLYFSIRACVRRRHARQLPVHTGQVRASMVHRHSSNDSRAALWAALGADAAGGRSNESVGPSTAHGHGGTDATYGGPVPVTRGTLRGGPGHRRHTSLLTDTPDDPPLPLAHDPTTPERPFIAMTDVSTEESSQQQHQKHQQNMVYVPWAGTAAPLSMRPFSMSRSPPPPPGAMVIPPGSSGVSLHRGTHYASESSLGHSQAHTELLQALDWGGATRMSTAGDHSHGYDHDHDHDHDHEELVAPAAVTSAHRRHDSIEPRTIGAWIAGAGGSTLSLVVRTTRH